MVTRDTLLAVLPPFKNERKLRLDSQSTEDIVDWLMKAHVKYAGDYDLIGLFFDTGDVVTTSKAIFDFLKKYVPYTKETGDFQTVKSPTAILTPGETIDCKNYSLFIAGVLDAIGRYYGEVLPWSFRFASYTNEAVPAHVFVVVKVGKKEIWIDPVFDTFNGGTMHTYEMDKRPQTKGIGAIYEISGPIYEISGPNDNNTSSGSVTVDVNASVSAFLTAVILDLYNIRSLLLSDTYTLNHEVKETFEAAGGNFILLLSILKNG